MKIFILILFFNFYKVNLEQIYKTFFLPEFLSILAITDSSIDFYFYTILRKNSALYYTYGQEEQKISSISEGDMISICYYKFENSFQIYIIVKNYLYVFLDKFIGYIELEHLVNKYSIIVLDECIEDSFCSLFISFINSENKLEIYKYQFAYNTTNYSKLVSKQIDLINSLGQISSNNCDYISCHKAKNESGLYALVCFYENDNSEIAAITLNKDTLDLEKEMKYKKNSGAKKIQSALFENDEKVFICYINNNDNLACITFDEPQNKFLNEFKYIEKMTQSRRYFNIEYFSSQNQYILSAYSSDTDFEYIIFDENMNILNGDSVKNIKVEACSDESSLLSITIYYYSNYKIAQKCGDGSFSTDLISEVSSSKTFSIEEIFITEKLIELPQSSLLDDNSLANNISSSYNLNGYLTDKLLSTTISDTVSSSYDKNILIPSDQKSTTIIDTDSIISYDDISTNIQYIDIIQPSSIKSDKTTSDIESNIEREKFSTNIISNDILTDEISTNTKLSILLSDEISINIKSSILSSDKIITETKSSGILSESFSFFNDENIDHEGKTIKIRTNKTLEFFINNLEKIIGEVNIKGIYEISGDHFIVKISPINYKEFDTDNSFINFLECENALRKANNLLPNDTLTEVMIEIDKNDDISLTNQIEYAVFYGKEQLELTVCGNNEIELNYDISNSTLINFQKIGDFSKLGVDILNSKDKFFNDICCPYAENNSDMILKDRISDIYQNYSKCDDNCKYKKIDLNSKLITCNCKIKTKIKQSIEPPRLESILLDLVTDSSFGVVKCQGLVFNFHNKLKNIGFWIFSIVILAHIKIIIHYSINTVNPINRYIISQMKKFYYITESYNPIKKKKSEKKTQFSIYNNIPINLININQIESKNTIKESSKKIMIFRKRKTHFNNRIENKLEEKNLTLSNKNLGDLSHAKLKKKSKTILVKNNDEHHNFFKKQMKGKYITTKKKETEINQKNDNDNSYNLIQINANNSPNNTPPESKCFLDNYNYEEAIIYDKRNFCRIYYICILAKENILNIILINSPLELTSLRICLLIFIYSCDFALNTLFYFNSNISDKYYYNGNNQFFFTIFNNISISIISTFISLVLLIFFKVMTTSKDNIEEIFRKEERKMRKNSNYVVNFIKRKQILMKIYEINKKLKIKIIIFFIIEFSLMLFFFYFVTAFCEVYKQSQISWITDSVISFLLSFPIEFGTAFLIAILYKISVQKKCKWLYKIVMIFYSLG